MKTGLISNTGSRWLAPLRKINLIKSRHVVKLMEKFYPEISATIGEPAFNEKRNGTPTPPG
jgi:hypothetical protein